MSHRTRILGYFLPLAVSVGLLFLMYRHVQAGQLVDEVRHAGLPWTLLYIVLSSVEPLVRGLRWSFLVGAKSRSAAIKGLYIAKAGNNLLPLRMGDAVRTQYLRDCEGIPYSTTAASILAETALDLVMLGLLVLFFALFAASATGVMMSVALLAGIPLAVFLFTRGARFVPRLLRRSFVFNVIGLLTARLRLILSSGNRIAVIALTALLWIVTLSASYSGLRMFLPHVGFMGVISSIVFVYFSVLVPSAPGFIGTYHAALAGSLAVMGYSLAEYPAVPIVLHLLQFIPQTIIGLIFGIRYLFSNDWRNALDGLNSARRKLFQGRAEA